MNVHYPDAILQGLRHRADAARGMLERTRGEVTSAVQQARLEAELRKARELLEGGA
jgi:translin